MTRLCYLVCDECTRQSMRMDAEQALLSAVITAGWLVSEERHLCFVCNEPGVRIQLPFRPMAARPDQLTWD